MPNNETAASRGRHQYATPQQSGRDNSLQPPQGVSRCEVGAPTPTPQPWEAANLRVRPVLDLLNDALHGACLRFGKVPDFLVMPAGDAVRLAGEVDAALNWRDWPDYVRGRTEQRLAEDHAAGKVRCHGMPVFLGDRYGAGWECCR